MSDHATLIEKLERTREDVVAAMAALDQSDRPVELDQSLQGRLSRMDAITQQQMAKAGGAHLSNELKRIDAALARNAAARYGQCCRCGEPVPRERLEADPATPFCLDCVQEMDEERDERR